MSPALEVFLYVLMITIVLVLILWIVGVFSFGDDSDNESQLDHKDDDFSEWVQYNNQTLAGYTISTSTINNVNSCYSLCKLNEICVGFTYDGTSKTCALKSVIDTTQLTSSTTVNTYAAPGDAPDGGKGGSDSSYQIINGNISGTSNVALVLNTTQSQCIEQIRENKQAKSAIFDPNNGNCQLKNTLTYVDLPILYSLPSGNDVSSTPLSQYTSSFENVPASFTSDIIASSLETSTDNCLSKFKAASGGVAFMYTKDSGKCVLLKSVTNKVTNLVALIPSMEM